MGDDKKLESFKVGDQHRDGLSPPAAKAGGEQGARDEGVSLGFTRIEDLLETEDPYEVGQSLNNLLGNLEQHAEAATTNKDKLAANKAIAAVERAVDLIDYLFQTKATLEAEASGEEG